MSVSARIRTADVIENISTDTDFDLYAHFGGNALVTAEHIQTHYGKSPLEAARKIMELSYQKEFGIITAADNSYPALLKEIDYPPLVLYTKGSFNADKCLSIVGTRQSKPDSEKAASTFAEYAAKKGFTIVSGLACGIDRYAHLGALSCGGKTIGVLPCGIDSIVPFSNRDIYGRIISSEYSSCISEHPPYIESRKWSFARRNRIISGLSRWTIIVHAGDRSGAMITARCALEQNREVLACPGPALDESYAGCHRLIRQGAALLSSLADLRDELGLSDNNQNHVQQELPFEEPEKNLPKKNTNPLITAVIENNISDIDSIARHLGMRIEEVAREITELEICGLLRREGNRVVSIG